ncbi:MAG: TRAP transporter small permease [Hydrogenophaga sp.]|jgi:TRAP-type C4-dicarboxylate transport system permease small subunit|nr:TRAP transporter small permease [Hydrogenophaga sp.]
MHKTIERLLYWSTGIMAAMALFSIMLLTVVDVTGRKFFDNSVPGGLELTEMLMVVVIFGALPLVSWRGEHVVFDTLDGFIPGWLRGVQARVIHLVCAGTFVFLGRLMVLRAERFAEYGDTTVYLALSIAPIAWLMAALLALTGLAHLLLAFLPAPAAQDAPAHAASGEGA